MNKELLNGLRNAFYVRSKISYYPLSHSIQSIADGLSVVIFENQDDIMEYYRIYGINSPDDFEIFKVRSLYDLMREMAEIGYSAFWYFKKMPILFGNYISDIDIEVPSFAYTPEREFIGASGLIEEPVQFYPWKNYFNNERYLQGYSLRTSEHNLIKTIYGVYELDKSLSLKKIDNTINDFSSDTIDKPNTIDPSLRGFLSTIKNPIKSVLGATLSVLTRKEAEVVINNLIKNCRYAEFHEGEYIDLIEQKNISSDSFLVFGFNRITGDEFSNNEERISPYVFTDIVDAILYFYSVHFSFEHDMGLNSYVNHISQTSGEHTNDKEKENYILSENRNAMIELMKMVLTQGYRIEHSELLMSYLNRSSISLEIEACGYLGDLGFFKASFIEEKLSKNEDSEIFKKIYNKIQSYKDKLGSKIDYDDKYQNKIKIFLGSTYKNLSPEGRCILESAIREFESNKRICFDYSGITMKLCKAFERELKNGIFLKWKKEILLNIEESILKKYLSEAERMDDVNVSTLLKFLLGRSKLELGPMYYIIERVIKKCDHEITNNLKVYLLGLKNNTYILSEEFLGHCNKILNRYRNGGVHEKVVSYDICQEAFENILMNYNCYLKMLLDL
jgi:hypothetical protein